MLKFLSFFIFLTGCLFSYSVTLLNDSPFELTALVQGADGTHLGEEHLQPGEQRQWSTDIKKTDVKEIYDAPSSLTPFTIIWKCAYKGYYSINNEVAPASLVKATDGDGAKTCAPKPEKEEEKKCPCPETPSPSSTK